MPTYKTPGVYIEEVSTLPPSVAEVSTAVPAFLGYTEKGPSIARIDTLLDYQRIFGGPEPAKFSIRTAGDPATGSANVQGIERDQAGHQFLLPYCVDLYFKNGGGSCYIISLGNYDATPTKAHFESGLARLESEDEPTIIVFPEANQLAGADYYAICQQALAQCEKLGDRFAVLDVRGGDVAAFRDPGVGTANLKYGAAYHPYLRTSLAYHYEETSVEIQGELSGEAAWQTRFGAGGITVRFQGAAGETPKVKILAGSAGDALDFVVEGRLLTIRNAADEIGSAVVAAWTNWGGDPANDAAGFDVTQAGDGSEEVPTSGATQHELDSQAAAAPTLSSIKTTETALHNQIKVALADQRVVMPPSAAVAGVYARVDRQRGVWKAPANVSLSSVIAPVEKITHEGQEGLNVDPTAGKSINAIRSFTGKGILVWGARTLAGNDNEWRYVSVRRLFNMIEESSRKSTSFAVFEPNDATTWLKVKGMIESFLFGLWERGALAGPTPEAAYFVNVGLGKTMTAQDVLEGRMIVEIGAAAVRPAEFIIIRFSHKLQEA